MSSYQKRGKGPGPLQRGEQTLSMFLAKNGNSLKPTRCGICGQDVSVKTISDHLRNCSKASSSTKADDSDSDIEIVGEIKSPSVKPKPKQSRKSTKRKSSRFSNTSDNPSSTNGNVSNESIEVQPSLDSTSSQAASVVASCKEPDVSACTAAAPTHERQSPSDKVALSPLNVAPLPGGDSHGGLFSPGAQVRLSPGVSRRSNRFAHGDVLINGTEDGARSLVKGRGRGQSRPRRGRAGRGRGANSNSNTPPRGRGRGRSPRGRRTPSSSAQKYTASSSSAPSSPITSPPSQPSTPRRLSKHSPLKYLHTPTRVRRKLYQPAARMMCETTFSSPESAASHRAEDATTPGGSPEKVRLPVQRNCVSEQRDDRAPQASAGEDLVEGSLDRVNGASQFSENVLVKVENGSQDAPNVAGTVQQREQNDGEAEGAYDGIPLPMENCSLKIAGVFGTDGETCQFGFTPLSSPLKSEADTETGARFTSTIGSSAEQVVNDPSTSGITGHPTMDDVGDDFAIDNDTLSQEFSQEMPETHQLASPQKHSTPYYLQNFLYIIESVLSDKLNTPLLDASDVDVIRRFNGLSARAQMLYVRLFQRKHAWIRADRIRYPEVGDEPATESFLQELITSGLFQSQQELTDVSELTSLLAAPQMKQLCQQLNLSSAGTREAQLERLNHHVRKQSGLFAFSPAAVVAKKAHALLGACVLVAPEARHVLLRVMSLFSIPSYEDDENTSQQLLRLLMVNLGRMVYPEVLLRKETAIFHCRDDLLRFEATSQLEVQTRTAMETKNWEDAYQTYLRAEEMWQDMKKDATLAVKDGKLPPFLRKFTASSVLIYTRTKGVELLQRRKDYTAAVLLLRDLLSQTTYLCDYRGLWWDRLALNLHQHVKDLGEAETAVRDGLADPWVRGGRRLSLEQRAERLKLPLPGDVPVLQPTHLPSVHIDARCLPKDVPGLKKVFLRTDETANGEVSVCSVEELALAHYRTKGYPEGVHREAAPTTTLFALLFWDILYQFPVPDSFRNQYQAAPLDLNCDCFYGRRQATIDSRLADLSQESADAACARLDVAWSANEGCLSLAAWDVFRDCAHAQSLLRCLGVPLVVAICRRLATDYRFSRSGFPDLVVWNPANGTSRIVEVKGPNDRLSTKQQLWLRYLLDHGANAEVCYVRAVGARRGVETNAPPADDASVPGGSRDPSPRKGRARAGKGQGTGDSSCRKGGPRKGPGVSEVDNEGKGRAVRRKRGRPRKQKIDTNDDDDFAGAENIQSSANAPKPARGRPKKTAKLSSASDSRRGTSLDTQGTQGDHSFRDSDDDFE